MHSKVAIIDDRLALISSCNINDRSMLADTDSELCVVVTGGEQVSVYMNSAPVPHRSKFVHELRVRLWREHLGLLDPLVAAGTCFWRDAALFGRRPSLLFPPCLMLMLGACCDDAVCAGCVDAVCLLC